MRTLLLPLALTACARLNGEACDCPGAVDGHAAMIRDQCACLQLPPLESVAPVTRFFVDPDLDGEAGTPTDPWGELDWQAIDAALAEGPVTVWISASEEDGSEPETLADPILIQRTDTSAHTLTIDGRRRTNTSDASPFWETVENGRHRARVPGVRTPFEGEFSHVIIQGLEITGSPDKGVSWHAGDFVVLQDLVVHDNRGSPAIYLDYSSRSGHRSESFLVQGTHVYNQPGECIYIGGAEGVDEPSHDLVVLQSNLVHDCRSPWNTRHDGINVKDRIGRAVVTGNVVFDSDWGIEVASPGLYAGNAVLDTDREGFQVSDVFQPIRQMVFQDNVVIGPGHDGFHVSTDRQPAEGLVLRRNTVLGAGEAGLMVNGEAATTVVVEDLAVFGSATGFDGWGAATATVDGCLTGGNGVDARRNLEGVSCASGTPPDVRRPAGPDGLWFTRDDPGYLPGGANLPDTDP